MYRILLFVILLSLVAWPASAASKIGIVDGEKLFDGYPQAQDASKKIAEAQDKLRDTITESEKRFSEFEKEKKSESEQLVKQRELQAQIDAEAAKTRELIESISEKLEIDILDSIKKIAQKKGIDVVFDKRAVLVGGEDITEEVAKILQSKKSLANGSPVPEQDAKN